MGDGFFEPLMQTALTTGVGALVGALVGAVIASVRSVGARAIDKSEQEREFADAEREAIKLLLMDKTRFLTAAAVKEGHITIRQRTFIHQMVDTAHILGANGEMTACAQEVDKLPTVNS